MPDDACHTDAVVAEEKEPAKKREGRKAQLYVNRHCRDMAGQKDR